MKTHQKKKAYRLSCKRKAQSEHINNAAGQWVNRSSLPDTSMKRDYAPQAR